MPSLPGPIAAIADDGDEFSFCSTCAFANACSASGVDKARLRELHMLVEHVGPFPAGAHLFREGDSFNAIAAVRSGTVKTYVTDPDGREQVRNFFLPGEVIGLDAISDSRYPCNALALEPVVVCRFSFPSLAALATRIPGLQQQLFRLLSHDIGIAALLAGNHSAEERLAAFLLGLSRRYGTCEFRSDRFVLTMGRADIANYLRLAPETVSRILRRFHDDKLARVRGREVELLDAGRLEMAAAPVLREVQG